MGRDTVFCFRFFRCFSIRKSDGRFLCFLPCDAVVKRLFLLWESLFYLLFDGCFLSVQVAMASCFCVSRR